MLHSDMDVMESIITDFFAKLFTSSNVSHLEEVISSVQTKVTEEMNEKLCSAYSGEEVDRALKQMHPSKASGPDGLNPFFYLKH